jgi:peptidyl-prolyl cis-trans isomerase A (cyclophilin A)
MSILLALFGLLLQTAVPAASPQAAPGNPVVVIETSAGTITAELFKDRAPVSVENFLQYARDWHYDGTIWHRVVSGYVIQGGGYTPQLVEKPTRPPIQNEATNGLSNRRGTLAMARTRQARSRPRSSHQPREQSVAGPRGFAPDDFTARSSAACSRIGFDKIAVVRTASRDGMDTVPVTPVLITSVTEKK